MRRVSLILVDLVLIALFIGAGAVQAQQLKKSTLSGEVFSRNVTVAAVGQANMFTVPVAQFAVMTESCVSGGGFVTTNAGANRVTPNGIGTCTTYYPGVVIGPGDSFACENVNGPAVTCQIMAVLTKP